MKMKSALVLLLVSLLSLIKEGVAVQCYECNVWKAGYGHMCDNARIRDDCNVCMKTETTIFMGYYKDTPRTSTTISRICGKSGTIRFSHECHHYTSADGHGVRCYCDNDLCNGAAFLGSSVYVPLILIPLSVVFSKFLSRS